MEDCLGGCKTKYITDICTLDATCNAAWESEESCYGSDTDC
jgi:hypothetical protein